MRKPYHLYCFFFFFFFSFSTTTGYFLPPASNDTDYIRTCCNTTRYPQTCFKSLSGYAASVHRDPVRLARVAIHVSLEKATHMATYVSGVSHRKKPLN
ncbi:pectinesterase inhibitor domain-containing protein, partial [Campylobacter jejuni]|uniref:pectinesterase inhibitor domain-containing protein n=1 Tax=Campylobacter jejuni TaxID=197 RepID=UPI003A5CCA2A